jgi:gluconolactonase
MLIAMQTRTYESGGRLERLDPRFDALVAPDSVVERVADGMVWAEGPVWDARDGALLFSDVPRNAIFRWHPDAGVTLFMERSGYTSDEPFEGRESGSNGLTFDRDGRLVFCQHGNRRVVRLEKDGRITVLADRFEGQRLNSPNDLVYASNGDLYFTDPIFGLPKAFDDPEKDLSFQAVFRLGATGELTALITDVRLPNGIGLSPDGRTLYVSNSERSRPVWIAYTLSASGAVVGERVFADASGWIQPDDGLPDGLKVDRAGNVFATGPGGVNVFAPDGTRLGRIHTGVPTGNVAFGPDGTLFIAANHSILRVRPRGAA